MLGGTVFSRHWIERHAGGSGSFAKFHQRDGGCFSNVVGVGFESDTPERKLASLQILTELTADFGEEPGLAASS